MTEVERVKASEVRKGDTVWWNEEWRRIRGLTGRLNWQRATTDDLEQERMVLRLVQSSGVAEGGIGETWTPTTREALADLLAWVQENTPNYSDEQRDNAVRDAIEALAASPVPVEPEASDYWYLCCECGKVTIGESWLAFNYNEAHEDETTPYEPRLIPAESDPSVFRCPACGHDHEDNDSGPGVFDGTRENVIAERTRLINDGWEFTPAVEPEEAEERVVNPKLGDQWTPKSRTLAECFVVGHVRGDSVFGFYHYEAGTSKEGRMKLTTLRRDWVEEAEDDR